MADCYYCNKDLELGSHDTHEHNVCHSEWEDRIWNGKCGMCGKNPRIDQTVYHCAECGANGEFRNYLGPR